MTSDFGHMSESFKKALADHLSDTGDRLSVLYCNGQKYWVKQRENLSFRMLLQKGDAGRAFETERRALHTLLKAGFPVPLIVAEGLDYFVTPDCGDTLFNIIYNPNLTIPDPVQGFEAAGLALVRLHGLNISHGRPAIKDICWRDEKITFLDFERYSPRRNTRRGHMQDLVIFVFSILTACQGRSEYLDAAIAGYRREDPANIWQLAQNYCKRMRWVDWITKPVQMRKPGKAKEFKAIPMVLDLFAGRHVPEGNLVPKNQPTSGV